MAVTVNQVKIQRIVEYYRYKYAGDLQKQDSLNRILWFSYPIVYPSSYDNTGGIKEAHRTLNALRRKKQRVQQRILSMQQSYYHLFFVTLTIEEEYMHNLSEQTIHKYAVQWFNINCRDYVANSDHGDKNGRLHYHGVVALLQDKSEVSSWQYGHSYIEPVRCTSDSPRISWYLSKLTNHAGKLTAGRIFSKRGSLKHVDQIPF